MVAPSPFAALTSVLIVDDSVVQRMFAVDLLQQIGVPQIHQASDGQHALTVLAALDPLPDLIVVDLEMPGMDGIELIQQMYSKDMLIPLVVVSARESSVIRSAENIIANLGLPLIGALPKPLSRSLLEPLLQQVDSDLRA